MGYQVILPRRPIIQLLFVIQIVAFDFIRVTFLRWISVSQVEKYKLVFQYQLIMQRSVCQIKMKHLVMPDSFDFKTHINYLIWVQFIYLFV